MSTGTSLRGRARPWSVLLLVLGLLGGSVIGVRAEPPDGEKIRFDLTALDAAGLHGPPDGLRALDYEFCIPERPYTIAQVQSIDASVRMLKSRGRIGCSTDELLCIGNTHQPGYRDVLAALSRLPYVARIDQAFFE